MWNNFLRHLWAKSYPLSQTIRQKQPYLHIFRLVLQTGAHCLSAESGSAFDFVLPYSQAKYFRPIGILFSSDFRLCFPQNTHTYTALCSHSIPRWWNNLSIPRLTNSRVLNRQLNVRYRNNPSGKNHSVCRSSTSKVWCWNSRVTFVNMII